MTYISKEELLKRLEEKYGDLDDDGGCTKNNKWFSLARIVEDVINECSEYEE